MTSFFIADLHLGHKGIITFNGDDGKPIRPFSSVEEHNEHIVASINKVVGKSDKLYILGDVAFGKANLEYLARIHGNKYLVAGNHDCYSTEAYMKYFNKIFGALAYKEGFILTHIPVHPQQLEGRFRYNIHGHLHTHSLNDERYICVSCEQVNYVPISYEEIIMKLRNDR